MPDNLKEHLQLHQLDLENYELHSTDYLDRIIKAFTDNYMYDDLIGLIKQFLDGNLTRIQYQFLKHIECLKYIQPTINIIHYGHFLPNFDIHNQEQIKEFSKCCSDFHRVIDPIIYTLIFRISTHKHLEMKILNNISHGSVYKSHFDYMEITVRN